jgi:hypothetical protein
LFFYKDMETFDFFSQLICSPYNQIIHHQINIGIWTGLLRNVPNLKAANNEGMTIR